MGVGRCHVKRSPIVRWLAEVGERGHLQGLACVVGILVGACAMESCTLTGYLDVV